MRIRYSSKAHGDLINIVAYSARTYGADVAKRLNHQLVGAIRTIGTYPEAWPLNPDYQDGMRSKIVGAYVIDYYIVAGEVLIAQIVPAAKDR